MEIKTARCERCSLPAENLGGGWWHAEEPTVEECWIKGVLLREGS